MKKSNLWTGVGMITVGILFLLAALLLDSPLEGLFCGFCGAFVCPGAVQVFRYMKWSRPENAAAYQERLERERIDLRDERRAMIRDKAGRYAYLLGLLLAVVAIVILAVLVELGIMETVGGRPVILFLGAYLIIEYVAGVFFFRLLEKKY